MKPSRLIGSILLLLIASIPCPASEPARGGADAPPTPNASPPLAADRLLRAAESIDHIDDAIARLRRLQARGDESHDPTRSVGHGLEGVRRDLRAASRSLVGLHWTEVGPFARRLVDAQRQIEAIARDDGSPRPPSNPIGSDDELTGTGTISGTVVDSVTLLPARSVRLWLRGQGISMETVSAVDGTYSFTGLATGHYRVAAQGETSGTVHHVPELYDDLPYSPLHWLYGDEIQVTDGQSTEGIDFALDPYRTLSGTITDATSGEPVEDILVTVFDALGDEYRQASSDATGRYEVDFIRPGTYYVRAETLWNQGPYLPQLYGGVDCQRDCDPRQGTPVVVPVEADVGGLNLALHRGGFIHGSVTAQATGSPIGNINVDVYDETGDHVVCALTEPDGSYVAGPLLPGSHFVIAAEQAFSGWAPELYLERPCLGGCDPTSGDPVAVALGQDTLGIDLALSRFGSISGTVTAAESGTPLTDAWLMVYDAGGTVRATWQGLPETGFEVSVRFPGDYFVVALHWGRLDRLYDGIDCELGCDPTTGTPIAVALDQKVTGIDFELPSGGALEGTTVDAISLQPVGWVPVDVYSPDGSLHATATTDSAGHWRVDGLPTASFFVRTRRGGHIFPSWFYVGMLYDDIPCPGQCEVTSGDPVFVAAPFTTSGVDFALRRYGSISGYVTDADGGSPIELVTLRVHDAAGVQLGYAWSTATGYYQYTGAVTGQYFVVADGDDHHESKLFDDLPCEPSDSCDPTAGDPVAVVTGQDTGGVDFALRRKASISGAVTDLEGLPQEHVNITIFDIQGAPATWAQTVADGTWQAGGLAAGTYFAWAGDYRYRRLLYDGLPCHPSCDPTTGTPIVLALAEQRGGVDFALEPMASLAGRITATDTGLPLFTGVEVLTPDGTVVASSVANFDGDFWVFGLEPGSYLLKAKGGLGYRPELWDDVPCDASSCDLGAATVLTVAAGADVTGFDFVLEPYPSVSGIVTVAPSGLPLSGATVRVQRLDGGWGGTATTISDGTFSTGGINPGAYVVKASKTGYETRLFDDVPCDPSCDLGLGTLVTVTPTTGADGVDFALWRYGNLAGLVTDRATGLPLEGTPVQLRSADGSSSLAYCDSAGYFTFSPLRPGDYTLATGSDDADHVDQLWQGLDCEPSCDLSFGTPVAIAVDTTSRIAFALRLPFFSDVWTEHWARRFVESLYHAGVTSGCAVEPLRYCPENQVLREQMAVFLLKADEGAGWLPPPATGVFDDVPVSSPYAAWIEALVTRGITVGCGPDLYCPDEPGDPGADGGLHPQDSGGRGLDAAPCDRGVPGRAGGQPLRFVGRGACPAGHHRRLRRRPLLPG